MRSTHGFRLSAGIGAMIVAGITLSGCVNSPTYGTGETAGAQLVSDLGQSVSLKGAEPKNKGVKYTPRPGLVVPTNASQQALVEPQKSLAGKENPEWVESPEETRARLVKEADENSEKSSYVSPLATRDATGRRLSTQEQQKAYRDARALQKGAYVNERRFISDPPAEYRDAGDPAKLEDLGEPELKKAKRRKKEAAVAGSGKEWWKIFN